MPNPMTGASTTSMAFIALATGMLPLGCEATATGSVTGVVEGTPLPAFGPPAFTTVDSTAGVPFLVTLYTTEPDACGFGAERVRLFAESVRTDIGNAAERAPARAELATIQDRIADESWELLVVAMPASNETLRSGDTAPVVNQTTDIPFAQAVLCRQSGPSVFEDDDNLGTTDRSRVCYQGRGGEVFSIVDGPEALGDAASEEVSMSLSGAFSLRNPQGAGAGEVEIEAEMPRRCDPLTEAWNTIIGQRRFVEPFIGAD